MSTRYSRARARCRGGRRASSASITRNERVEASAGCADEGARDGGGSGARANEGTAPAPALSREGAATGGGAVLAAAGGAVGVPPCARGAVSLAPVPTGTADAECAGAGGGTAGGTRVARDRTGVAFFAGGGGAWAVLRVRRAAGARWPGSAAAGDSLAAGSAGFADRDAAAPAAGAGRARALAGAVPAALLPDARLRGGFGPSFSSMAAV